MISIVRDKDGNIKTFQQSLLEDYNKSLGESIEYIDTSMEEFANRFTLSADGCTGETLVIPVGADDVTVDVVCPGVASVGVMVNDLQVEVDLVTGKGSLTLSTVNPGIFTISPADRRKYCAAGNGLLVVQVVRNE